MCIRDSGLSCRDAYAFEGAQRLDRTVCLSVLLEIYLYLSLIHIYKIDLADQSAGIAGHDLMWAKVENKASDELLSSGLSMTFHHRCV